MQHPNAYNAASSTVHIGGHLLPSLVPCASWIGSYRHNDACRLP
jgi:hypothetical protein